MIEDHKIISSNPTLDNFLTSSKLNYEINARAVEKLFTEFIGHSNNFTSISFVDYLGSEKIRVDKELGRIKSYRNLKKMDIFKELDSNVRGKIGLSVPYINENGEVQVTTGVNVIDEDIGEFGGAVLLEFSFQEFMKSLNKIKIYGVNAVW
ncbi:hypothetical protein ACFL2A_06130, partial [Thermodesulfobacteriota bacterium]